MRNERWRRRGWSRERKGEGESSERDLRKERDVGEERESRGEGAHRKGRRREAGACARAAESSPSSEIQDPSRERAADGKHSLDRGDGLRLGATRRRVRPLLRASLPVSLARTRSLLSRTRSRQRSHKLGSTRRTGRPASCGFLLRDRFDRVGLDVGLDHLEPRGSWPPPPPMPKMIKKQWLGLSSEALDRGRDVDPGFSGLLAWGGVTAWLEWVVTVMWELLSAVRSLTRWQWCEDSVRGLDSLIWKLLLELLLEKDRFAGSVELTLRRRCEWSLEFLCYYFKVSTINEQSYHLGETLRSASEFFSNFLIA